MRPALFFTALAVLAAGAAAAQDQPQRLDVDPAIKAPYDAPIALDGSRVIVSELTESDFAPLPGFRAEYFRFSGHAGDRVSATVKTEVYGLQLAFSQETPRRELARDVPERGPFTFVLPRDGTYLLVVDSRGPRRYGKYELDFQTSASPPGPVGLAAAAGSPAKALAPASPRQAELVEMSPTQVARPTQPFPVKTRQLIAGEISGSDWVAGPDWNADVLAITARAGEMVTAQLKSDIPTLEVHVHDAESHTGQALLEGPARDAPLRFTAPKDGTYLVFVHAKGPQRFGKYLLALGGADGAPTPELPKPPSEVAEAAKPAPPIVAPAPQPAAPKPAQTQAATPAGPKTSPPATSGPPPLPQIPGVINARAGQTLSRPAAAKSGPATEMFQLLAAGGSDLQFTASGSGKLMLILYTIDGEEILSASGADILRLDVIAPRDDLYFLSVWRADAAKPYRLNLVEKEVEPVAASVRYGVGFEDVGEDGKVARSSCWVQPGVKQRRAYADGRVVLMTHLGDGRIRGETSYPDKPSTTTEWTVSLDGEEATQTFASGGSNKYRPFDRRFGAYRGYLCK